MKTTAQTAEREWTVKKMAEINVENMAQEVFETVMNDFSYRGKKVREWIGIIAGGNIVEVVHGKAMPVSIDIDSDYTLIRMDRQCSECTALMTKYDNYCPMCGAKMDGDEND